MNGQQNIKNKDDILTINILYRPKGGRSRMACGKAFGSR